MCINLRMKKECHVLPGETVAKVALVGAEGDKQGQIQVSLAEVVEVVGH